MFFYIFPYFPFFFFIFGNFEIVIALSGNLAVGSGVNSCLLVLTSAGAGNLPVPVHRKRVLNLRPSLVWRVPVVGLFLAPKRRWKSRRTSRICENLAYEI